MKAAPLSLFVPFYLMAAILLLHHPQMAKKTPPASFSIPPRPMNVTEPRFRNFENSERDRTKDGDKTHSVTMLEGSPYERLIAVNGKNLTSPKQKE